MMQKVISLCSFQYAYFNHYTFEEEPKFMGYNSVYNKLMQFYVNCAQKLGVQILPLIFVAPEERRLHFHTIEMTDKSIPHLQREKILQSEWYKRWNGRGGGMLPHKSIKCYNVFT